MPRQLGRVELREHLVEARRLPAKGFCDLRQRPLHADLGERDGAVALGQPCPVLVEHQCDVRVRRLRIAEQPREVGLPRRRRQQVVTAHHLVDALRGVVDHDREVVGRDAVAATDHEVVDDAGVLAVQQVVDRVDDRVGAQPQRRRPPGLARGGPRVRASVRSRHVPGYAPCGACGARGACAISLLAAIAFVQQAAASQLVDRRRRSAADARSATRPARPTSSRSPRDRRAGGWRCRCGCGRRDPRRASGSDARSTGRTATPARRCAGCRCAGRPTGSARTCPLRVPCPQLALV